MDNMQTDERGVMPEEPARVVGLCRCPVHGLAEWARTDPTTGDRTCAMNVGETDCGLVMDPPALWFSGPVIARVRGYLDVDAPSEAVRYLRGLSRG